MCEQFELVRLARKTMQECFDNESEIKQTKFNKKQGVFVTIFSYPDKKLRGCVGYPNPEYPLGEAVQRASIFAMSDPRFEHIEKNELEKIIIEVSVLTESILVEKPYEDNIKIGKDGLFIIYNEYSGLLLPQVPLEFNWDTKEYLRQICLKANLPAGIIKKSETKLYKFESIIYTEEKPNGEILVKH